MRYKKELSNFSFISVLSAGLGAAALLLTPRARAQSDGAGPQPWAVRADTFVFSAPGIFGSSAGAIGGTVQRKMLDWVALEGSVGTGIGEVSGEGHGGWALAGTVRTSPIMSRSGVNALSVAGGVASFVGGDYGDLHFAFAELGYEARPTEGPTLLIAIGPNLLLSRPKRSTCQDAWFCRELERGDLAPLGHLRVSVGVPF